jgi:2'-hydroxyisoflavone reductase
MQVNNDRAMAAGLTFRPIGDTAKDMLAELREHGVPDPWRGGLDPATEAEVLKKWHAEKG